MKKDLLLGSDILGTHDWVLFGSEQLLQRYYDIDAMDVETLLCQSFRMLASDLKYDDSLYSTL